MKSGLNIQNWLWKVFRKKKKIQRRKNKGRGQAQGRAQQADPSGIRAPRGSGLLGSVRPLGRSGSSLRKVRGGGGDSARARAGTAPRPPGTRFPAVLPPAAPERPGRGGAWSRAAAVATPLPRLPRAGADAQRRGWVRLPGPRRRRGAPWAGVSAPSRPPPVTAPRARAWSRAAWGVRAAAPPLRPARQPRPGEARAAPYSGAGRRALGRRPGAN